MINRRKVIKRNGELEEFDSDKIIKAVTSAFESIGQKYPARLAKSLIQSILVNMPDTVKVEEIQDRVERKLMDGKYFQAAKAYILYRDKHKENGLVREKINYILNYAKSDKNAASSSNTDANANNKIKNVASIEPEVFKDKIRLIQRQLLKDKLNILYPEIAKQYEKDLNHHIIYSHDESNSAIPKAYTYSCKEVIEVYYGDKHWMLPFDQLYDLIDSKEVLVDEKEQVYQKYPKCLFVKDVDNKFTKVSIITKKKRSRDLVRIKTVFGEDIVVTDNHPLIVDSDNIDNTIQAIDSLGYKQFKVNKTLEFDNIDVLDFVSILPSWVVYEDNFINYTTQNTTQSMQRYLKFNKEFGYIVGFFIGDGNYDNSNKAIHFTQKEKETLKTINNYIFNVFGIAGRIVNNTEKDKYSLIVNNKFIFELFRNYFGILDKSQNKTIPINVLHFTEDFAEGILAGLIDSDGTIKPNDCQISLRLSSRACIMQATALFRHFGYSVGNGMQSLPFSNNTSYNTNYTVWGVNATKTVNSKDLELSFKVKEKLIDSKSSSLKYHKDGECTVSHVDIIESESAFLIQNEYIYDITTETHTFELNNLLVHNCGAYSLYPLMTDGVGNIDKVTPTPPNDIQSFSGQVTNLVFALSAMTKGAVALGDYFVTLNYYVVKEFGEGWYKHLDDVIRTVGNNISKYTIKREIKKGMKQYIYGINQPQGNRGFQSPFVNNQICDKYYFEALFEDYYYPDGTKPKWEAIDALQRIFISLLRELRTIKPFTFPVLTMSLVYDKETGYKDKEYAELCADEWSKGSSHFLYHNSNPNVLSSCCFSEDTKVLWKSSTSGVQLTTFKELSELPHKDNKENFKVFHNGSWVRAKLVELPKRQMYRIVTENNKEYIVSDNHIHLTYNGEVTTDRLTVNEYLMFNTKELYEIKENSEGLTYEQGLLIGLFIGDGSFGNYVCLDNSVHSFQLSLNKDKWEKVKDKLEILGDFKLGTIYNNVYPVKCHSKELTSFISKWTGNEPNSTYAYNKSLNLNCLQQSVDFRKGILDGWYITDGGNSNRCYTTSKNLIERMEILCTSLGLQCRVDISDRTDEEVIIREEKYNRNYPLYCLRWYSTTNNRTRPESGFKWKNNSIYWKIKTIEKIDYNPSNIYCFECENKEEPYFTLPSGLITHNCRVSNELSENFFTSTTGMLGLMTGSCNVITLNINRIVQDWYRSINLPNPFSLSYYKDSLVKYIQDILDRVYKYHIAYKTMLYELEEQGMITYSTANYLYIKKLYSTIGVIGYYEAAKFLELEDNSEEYKNFITLIMTTINEYNKKNSINDSKRPFIFNLEAIPGENLAVKLYNWDKNDGYKVPEDQLLYNCYFFNPWKEINIINKIKLHGGEISKASNGGQACHINLNEHLSKEQYLKIMDIARVEGCDYFTFNVPMTECKDCGHVSIVPINKCPKCGSEHVSHWTRIIGFLVEMSNSSEARFAEFKDRLFGNAKIQQF